MVANLPYKPQSEDDSRPFNPERDTRKNVGGSTWVNHRATTSAYSASMAFRKGKKIRSCHGKK